jgi:hypothetical protein
MKHLSFICLESTISAVSVCLSDKDTQTCMHIYQGTDNITVKYGVVAAIFSFI